MALDNNRALLGEILVRRPYEWLYSFFEELFLEIKVIAENYDFYVVPKQESFTHK
jgi:hydroxymethylpyrimidine pyrophosphatase-like HAD family hydrolase